MKTKARSTHFLYLWLIIFGLIPLSMVLLAGFLSRDAQHLVRLPFTLQNYQALISPLFLKIFFRSAYIALMTSLSCLVLAYPFSYLLTRTRHQSILLILIIIPFWTSSLVRTYALISILKFNGLANTLLLKLHIINEPMTLLYTNLAVFIGLVYNLFPFMVLPIFTNMERFDFRLIDAAYDLGASKFSAFFRIFLPNTLNGVISGFMLVFLPAMTLFYIPNVLGGARAILLGNMIQEQFLVLENWPQGAASSTLLTVILLLCVKLYRKQEQSY